MQKLIDLLRRRKPNFDKNNILDWQNSGICGVAVVSAIFAAEDIESECRLLRALSEEMVSA